MDKIYVPPNFVDSHLVPYIADALDAELKDALEVYEFSARYFEEKARKKREENEIKKKNNSSNENEMEWIDREAPVFGYEKYIELHPIDLKESDLKAYGTDKNNEKNVTHIEDEQMTDHLDTYINNQFKSDKKQKNDQVLHGYYDYLTMDQVKEFARLLPEYIAEIVDKMEDLGEEEQVKRKEKVFENKETESDETTPSVFNDSELKVEPYKSKPTSLRNTPSVNQNCKMMPRKEIIPFVSVEKDKDSNSPSFIEEDTINEKKTDIPQSLDSNDIKKEHDSQIPQNNTSNGYEIFHPTLDSDIKRMQPIRDLIISDLIKNLREKLKYKTNKNMDEFFVLATKFYDDKDHPCLCHKTLEDLKRDLEFAFEINGYEEDEESLSDELLNPMQKREELEEILLNKKSDNDGQDAAAKKLVPQSKRNPIQIFQEMNGEKHKDSKFNENVKSPTHDTSKFQHLDTNNEVETYNHLEKGNTTFSSVERTFHPATIVDLPKQEARDVKPELQFLTSDTELNISKKFGQLRVPKLETKSTPVTADIEKCETPVSKSAKYFFEEQKRLKSAIEKGGRRPRGIPFDNKQDFQATEELKSKTQHLNQSQRLKLLEELANGNSSALRGSHNEVGGIPINGQSWLRTYFTVQTIKHIREEDWRTLYVEGQDDDLGHPIWMPQYLTNPEPTNFLQWLGFFKACRTWYFARRLNAYQKHLRYKS